MNIYVSTTKGKRFHGILEGNIFKRNIDGRYVRWSDQSFTINTDAVRQIKNICDKIIFVYQKSTEIKTYSIEASRAFQFRSIINEYGESNIRIPIEKCYLESTQQIELKFEVKKFSQPIIDPQLAMF